MILAGFERMVSGMVDVFLYERLKKLQKKVWKDDDRMSQDTLFEVQEDLATLILEVARRCNKERDLAESFPWIYTRQK